MASYTVNSYQHNRVKSTSYQASKADQDIIKIAAGVAAFLFACFAVNCLAGVVGSLSLYLF